ncbi:MAG: hypothetical protein ABIR59_07355 [Gemmatimonadales bacterium]
MGGVDSQGGPFTGINDATRLSGGSTAIADGAEGAIKVIDAGGTLIRTIGRRGEGPGEFGSLEWIEQCLPDTLFVWDRVLHRVTVFDSSGRTIRQFTPPGSPIRMACNSVGQVVVMMRPVMEPNQSVDAQLFASTVVINAFGDSIGSIGMIQAGQNRPLGTMSGFGVLPGVAIVGTAASSILSFHSFIGDTIRVLSLPTQRRVATLRHYRAAIERLMSAVGPSPADDQIRRTLLAVPMPDSLPMFRGLFVTSTGFAWVVTSSYGDGYTDIVGVRLDGPETYAIRLPIEIEVFEIGADFILGRTADEGGGSKLAGYHFSLVGLSKP